MISKQEIKEVLKRIEIRSFYSTQHDLEFDLWKIDELDEYNELYKVEKFVPGYYGIGTNGSGELLTVEMKSEVVYSIPFIPMDDSERIEISESIDKLILLSPRSPAKDSQ
jgi:hypothetical protein